MIFSAITERSLPVRTLYACLYVLLSLGALTMVVPFVIMISGSLDPRAIPDDDIFFPRYLVSEETLWQRYVEAKYHGQEDLLRMAWNDPDISFKDVRAKLHSQSDAEAVELWQKFVEETQPRGDLFAVGFLRPDGRMPSAALFGFRDWLKKKYATLNEVNARLGSNYTQITKIPFPRIAADGAPLPASELVRHFLQFAEGLPPSWKFAWDIGSHYRANILPPLLGGSIESFNALYGTDYRSYSEVPFTSTVPQVASEAWFFYVSQLLRPDFVELTEKGEKRRSEQGISKEEFIRSQAGPEDLRVVSLDTLFSEWAASKGLNGLRIPQASLDRAAFALEKRHWRWHFITANYRRVAEEIFIHGRAVANTIILVILSISGALLINPLAAYALSRFKMRSSFKILLFFLATIAFPAEVTMIPVFLQLKEFHLLNTFGALVLPGLANGFSIFLLKGFFDSLPRELYEAAELDGAGEFVMFWNITMNLSRPILAVIALGAFVNAYGTFFYALILAPDPKMWTVMVYVFQLRMFSAPPVVYASLILTAIPTLIVFVTCQNIILRGIVVPAEK